MDSKASLEGRTLDGRYRVEKLLGEGAYGAVYEGTQLAVDRRVAIKVLHPKHKGREDFKKRFEVEGKAIARLNHPGCIRLYDYGSEDDICYMVTEFIEGQELAERMELPLKKVRIIHKAVRAFQRPAQTGGSGADGEGPTLSEMLSDERSLTPDEQVLLDDDLETIGRLELHPRRLASPHDAGQFARRILQREVQMPARMPFEVADFSHDVQRGRQCHFDGILHHRGDLGDGDRGTGVVRGFVLASRGRSERAEADEQRSGDKDGGG